MNNTKTNQTTTATIIVDHIEAETAKAYNFDGVWIAKKLINKVTRRDGVVCEIEVPEWLAVREGLHFAAPTPAGVKVPTPAKPNCFR